MELWPSHGVCNGNSWHAGVNVTFSFNEQIALIYYVRHAIFHHIHGIILKEKAIAQLSTRYIGP